MGGAYYLRGEQVELHAQIVDPWAENKLLCTFDPIRGSATNLTKAIDLLCQRVAGAVAMHVTRDYALGVMTPPLLDAFREYQLGVALFGINYEKAYKHHEKALSIDPEFCWPRLQIFFGLWDQGKYEQAETQLAMLEANLGRMTPAERLVVRAGRALQEGRVLDELAAYCDLAIMAPAIQSFSYLRGLGQIAVNRPHDAISSYMTIPVEYAPQTGARAWPSEKLAEAYHLADDFEGELRVAKERLAHFPDVLELYSHQAMALAALGHLDEVDRVIDACLTVPARSGTPMTVMVDAAYELRAHGHREKSLAAGERAVSCLRSRSPEELRSRRSELATALYVTEHWKESREIFKELAAEDPQNIDFQGSLGALAARLGEHAEAERITEALRKLEARYRYGLHTYCRARIASLLGEKEKAVALLREAFAQGYYFSISIHRDPDFEPLRNYPPYKELIKPKDDAR